MEKKYTKLNYKVFTPNFGLEKLDQIKKIHQAQS